MFNRTLSKREELASYRLLCIFRFRSQFTISVASSNFSAQVGLPALQSEEKFPSAGSLLPQNGIKYCSEPELKSADDARAPQRSGSRACSEGPECEGYVNIERGPGGQS